jgi:predicted nucleic acid-binding protein
MKYVLDSSVAFKWLVVETDTDKARRLRDAYRHGIHELVSPDIFPVELGHALTRAERQARIMPPEAARFWADAMKTAPRLQASLPFTPRAIAISSQMRVSVYDCLYLALAEQEQCAFVTADDRLVRTLQPHFPFIVPLSSLP